MIKDIKELNFPEYATLSQATCTLQDMADKFITTQVKIDGAITPDFSYDWEIEFKGEKYIMPLRQPQAAKENTSLNSTIDLTFYHWAQYQLKRQYFFTIQPVETGTAVADKYIAPVSLNLKDFCELFSQVLDYYFNGDITIDLNPEWAFAEEPTTVEISYSYLWDVLIQFYDLWAVRWQIEPKDGDPDKYVIKVGYPVAEVDHIFEYGFNGGLLKIERQVQDDNIRNMLLGRGGDKSLPYRYFKDIDPQTPSFPADPDWIPELRNIYFSELRGKTFRDYVKGWKTNPHRQLTEADGTPIAPYIITYPTGGSVQTQLLPKMERSSFYISCSGAIINIQGSEFINIPQGYRGNFRDGTIDLYTIYEEYDIYQDTYTDIVVHDVVDVTTEITLIDRNTGETIASVDVPPGEYDYSVKFDLQNKYVGSLRVDLAYEGLELIKTPIQEVKPNVETPISVEPYDEKYAVTSWAYKRGHEDEKFDPVEYVKDDASIAKYGELMGGLENNEEIYPSIQGVTVDPYGRIDEVVDVEPITSDDIEESVENDSVISNIPNGAFSYTSSELATNYTASTTFPKVTFTVPAGKLANLLVLEDVEILKVYVGNKTANKIVHQDNFGIYAQIEEKEVKVYDSATNKERASVGIPEGSYYYVISVKVKYISAAYKKAKITVGIETPRIQYGTSQDEKWRGTWDIWVKNIWGSEKRSDETDAQYAERVWLPILGDRTGEEAKVVFSTGMLSTSQDYEFVIAKTPVYDTSKTLNGVPSHWRLTLGKSDADLESTGLYLPSTMRQGKAGDHFFFVGIDMPHQYVLWAEQRLDNYKTDNLDEVKDIKPTWVVSLDKVRIANTQQGELQPLISQLHVGDSIRLADKRFILNEEGEETAYEILYLQSITYNYREPSSSSPALIPDVEVVLSDKYETIANPIATLSGDVSALTKQIGAMSNVEQVVRAVGDKLYLRKDGISDRSMSPTEFFSKVTGRDFRSGIVGGASWGIYQDANGNWVVEADRFKARQDFEVNNLVINQIIARGGMIIESAAQMEVTRVVETDEGYVCYFDQKMGSVANLFHVDDVAYCSRFTPENTDLKFYKRRVVAVSADSITLTKDTDFNGEGIPEEGDTIVQFGNYTDTARQYAKVRDVIGGGYERYLEGLDSVNAAGKEYYFAGKQDGQNPRWFIGYKDRNYAEWRDGNLYIKGNIEMGPDSTGLSSLPEFKQVQESADAAADAANAANEAADKINNIKIGGRNLLLDSGVEIRSNEYSFASYMLSERINDGQEVTLTLWGGLDDSLVRIVPYNSSGMLSLVPDSDCVAFTEAIKQTGKGSVTFKWRSDVNLFSYTKTTGFVNASKVNQYAYKQTTADSNILKWKMQGFTTDGEYIGFKQELFGDTGRHTIHFTVPRNKEFEYFRFGLNGSEIDTLAIFNADLTPGDYTLSFDLDNNIQGEIEFSHIKILPGYNDDTDWIASLYDRGTRIPNDHIVLFAMNAGHNEQNLTTKIIYRAQLEYGNVSTDWAPAPEDLDFIRQIFPSGLINNTATVSQLLAVKDSTDANANVVAGIYGGGVPELEKNGFWDNAHGKLMIFAGAKEGIKDNKVESAATRIYEDGTLITSGLIAIDADISGKITASSGTIGGFSIEKGGLTSTKIDWLTKKPVINIGQDDIHIWGDQFVAPYIEERNDFTSSRWVLKLTQNSPSTRGLTDLSCLYLDSYEPSLPVSDRNALYIRRGNIMGFRPYTRYVSTSETLNSSDSVILAAASSNITLTLPANPENGQLYFIKNISASSSSLTLTVGATGHYINSGKSRKDRSWSWGDGQIIIVIWDNVAEIWQAGYTNSR